MRIIDVHCHPGTERWHQTMAPYLAALRSYWGQDWPVKTEQEMIADFERNGVEPVIVALDVAHTANTPPTDNDYVAALRDRHGCIAQAWGTVDPHRGACISIRSPAATPSATVRITRCGRRSRTGARRSASTSA